MVNFAKPKTGQKAAAPQKKESMWKGVQSAAPRTPEPKKGKYRLRVEMTQEGVNDQTKNKSFKVDATIVKRFSEAGTDEGDDVFMGWVFTGSKAASYNMNRIKAFVVATAGFDSDDAFDEFDPDGELIDACLGAPNKFGENGPPLNGRLVDVVVTLSNNPKKDKAGNPTGEFYRQYEWFPVPDEEQEQAE